MEIRKVTIDAAGKNIGRVATRAATELLGKTNVEFQKNLALPVEVVIINAEKVQVSGKKDNQKTYTRYSGYPGGLKKIPYTRMKGKDETLPIKLAVEGMLPRNRLRTARMKNLQVFVGEAK